MPRWTKQFLVGIVYLIIFALFGFGIYRANNPAPTCTDGAKNQTEDGVDCGTVCGKLCIAAPVDLKVHSVHVLNTRPEEYDIIAEIENPNDIYGATNISYTLSLVNSSNGALATERGTLYILPNQTRYLVATAVKIKGEVAKGIVSLTQPQWMHVDPNAPHIDFPLRREQYAVQGKTSTFEGTLYNDSNFDFGKIDVVVTLLNAQGTIVGINRTEITTVRSQTERYFKVSWPFVVDGAIASTRVQATTDVFKNENFLKRYGNLEEFQQF